MSSASVLLLAGAVCTREYHSRSSGESSYTFMKLVEHVQSGALDIAMPSHEAAARFEEERTEAAKKTVWATGCNSWYLDDRGIPFAWPFPFTRFRSEMDAPRLEDYESSSRAA